MRYCICLLACSLVIPLPPACAADGLPLEGKVLDPGGTPVPGAGLLLVSPQQSVIAATLTDSAGSFRLDGIPPGSYVLLVSARALAPRRIPISLREAGLPPLMVRLELRALRDTVTVTAEAGSAGDAAVMPQSINIVGEDQLRERIAAVTAQAAAEETGLSLQRTSPTIAGVFVRGLTGNKVGVYFDGIRYSNSAARGGINTFLDLIEPSSLQAVEVLRGPNSAQYGSDAIGGSLQFLSRLPALSSSADPEWRGSLESSFNTSDMGVSSHLSLNYGTPSFALLSHMAGRRVSTLRPGRGIDSHNAVLRFLGLGSEKVLRGRLPDTAFTQYGGMVKLIWSPSSRSQWVAHYSRSQTDGGKRYDQLLGGDGNLLADLRNLKLDLFYLKYSLFKAGPLDQLTLSYSMNIQREERVNQGGNGNPRATIQFDPERTPAHGIQLLARKFWLRRHETVGGAEYYREKILAPAFGVNPVTLVSSLRRPRIPAKARYNSGAFFLQDSFGAVRSRLRLSGSLRASMAAYRSRAADSPAAPDGPLWPDDSLRVSDLTGRAGAAFRIDNGLSAFGSISRGFRAPHMTDLGTFGLTGSGFEVAAPDVASLNGWIGTTAAGDAISSGRRVEQVRPESSISYEAGIRYQDRKFATDLAFFINTVRDSITKQALILPLGAVGKTLAGQTITSQGANGVVYVALSGAPVLVRANYGDARIRGLEHALDWRMSPAWSLGTRLTLLRAWDTQAGLPPAIEGGTPAPDGYLKIRYATPGGRVWIEPYMHAAGRQDRLSSLDLEDRRTGAMRTRSSIRSFFLNGATFLGLVHQGPDGAAGTADDYLRATGETLSQVQDRVLGVGVQRSPLFAAVPGYITFSLRGGWKIAERQDLMIDFSNIGDRNYRGISWGLDAPGRSLGLRYRISW